MVKCRSSILAPFPVSYIKHALFFLCVSYPVSVCALVFRRVTLSLSSPVWVVEDDLSGHSRLLGLLVGWERQGNGRSGDAVSPTYHPIGSGHCVGACACVCVRVRICHDSLSTRTLSPKPTPVSDSQTKQHHCLDGYDDWGGHWVLSGPDKVRVSVPGWGGLSPVSSLDTSLSLYEGRQERTETHIRTMIYALPCLASSFSFWRSFNELRINGTLPSDPNPPVCCSRCLCLPFVWLVSVPIAARLSDSWVTSERQSTWQPESARTASRA